MAKKCVPHGKVTKVWDIHGNKSATVQADQSEWHVISAFFNNVVVLRELTAMRIIIRTRCSAANRFWAMLMHCIWGC